MPRQPSPNQREAGTVLRRLRTEAASIQVDRRVRPLAQRNQTTHEPQLGNPRDADPSVPEETATKRREKRNSRTPSEIIMGNHTTSA